MPENLDVYRKEVQKETGGMEWINKATIFGRNVKGLVTVM